MMNNRLTGMLLFVLLALAFAGCSSSIASTPKVAASPTLKGALEVNIVLSDSADPGVSNHLCSGCPLPL
jgi:predicted component of type VI protein secretion system